MLHLSRARRHHDKQEELPDESRHELRLSTDELGSEVVEGRGIFEDVPDFLVDDARSVFSARFLF